MTIDDEGWTERRPTEGIPRAARAVTILIVDDDELVLRAIERSLRDEGFHLVFTTEPGRALELIADKHVDMIVCDQRMPGVLGVNLLAQVRERCPHVARILMSAHLDLDVVVRAVNECGVSQIFHKPWAGAKLRSMLHDVERSIVDRDWRNAAS